MTASTLLVSAMCFSFAQWSSEIKLDGSVSASGKWDVAVTAAGINLSSGASVSSTETTMENVTYAAKAYKVVLGEGSATQYYLMLDTVSGVFDDVDLSGYTRSGQSSYGNSQSFASSLTGGKGSLSEESGMGMYNYYLIDDIAGTNKSASTNNLVKFIQKADYNFDSYVGQMIGYAALPANIATKEVAVSTAGETTYTDTAVSYAGVEFSIPGAWAEYSVTITNNGTVNANLSDYEFVTSKLDDAVFTVDTPELGNDVLAPGESCTFTFVVQADTEANELAADAAEFTVTLNYVQDTVEAAPSASHSH